MHFTNVLVSIVAMASVTTATLSQRMYDEPLQALDIRDYEDVHEEMLAARDEYIEKRDLFRRVSPPPFPSACSSKTLRLLTWHLQTAGR